MENKEENTIISEYIPVYKYLLLNICTFNIYEFVWIYRQWVYISNKYRRNISAAKRAFFTPIFFFSLIYIINKNRKIDKIANYFITIIYGSIYFLFNAYVVLSKNYYLFFLSFVLTIPLLVFQNKYFKTNEDNINIRKIKSWQKIILGFGFIINVLILIGSFMI